MRHCNEMCLPNAFLQKYNIVYTIVYNNIMGNINICGMVLHSESHCLFACISVSSFKLPGSEWDRGGVEMQGGKLSSAPGCPALLETNLVFHNPVVGGQAAKAVK